MRFWCYSTCLPRNRADFSYWQFNNCCGWHDIYDLSPIFLVTPLDSRSCASDAHRPSHRFESIAFDSWQVVLDQDRVGRASSAIFSPGGHWQRSPVGAVRTVLELRRNLQHSAGTASGGASHLIPIIHFFHLSKPAIQYMLHTWVSTTSAHTWLHEYEQSF